MSFTGLDFEEQYQSFFTPDDSAEGKKRKKIIDSPYLHKAQRKHFIIFDILPLIGTIVAIALLPFHTIGIVEISLFLVMWILTGFGISVGYHRLFTHRSFKTTAWLEAVFAICGSMAGQGGVISWVAMHRCHHEFGDDEGDLHSPNLSGEGLAGKLRGFLHAHFTWMAAHPYPNVVLYAPDLLRNKGLLFISRKYYYWALLGLLIPSVLGGILTHSWIGVLTGFLWGGMVRMFVLEQGIWSLNSLCHLFGSRRFRTNDQSHNIGWMAPFIFGESWHHNHHAFPDSASFGLAWYRIDPGYWLISILSMLGLAYDIKVPSNELINMRTQNS